MQAADEGLVFMAHFEDDLDYGNSLDQMPPSFPLQSGVKVIN
ncbi:hypothetical protein RQN46_00710 [Arcanobacterium hippocoleae]